MPNAITLSNAHTGENVFCVKWIDETQIVSGGADNQARVWDIRGVSTQLQSGGLVHSGNVCIGGESGEPAQEFRGHLGGVRGVAVSPPVGNSDTRFLTTSCDDGSARVWRLNDLQLKKAALDKYKQARGGNAGGGLGGSEKVQKLQNEYLSAEQDGYTAALVGCTGHKLCASSCSLILDPMSSRPGRFRLLTSGWDQAVSLYDIDLVESV